MTNTQRPVSGNQLTNSRRRKHGPLSSPRQFFSFFAGMMALAAVAACSNNPGSNLSVGTHQKALSGIIGGAVATGSEDFSKTVVALYGVKNGSLCTASIISDSLLVSAAHCVLSPASELRVIFGTDIRATTRIIRPVVSYVTNPSWATNSEADKNTGDIAVIRFSGGLPEGFHAATLLADRSVLAANTTVLLAGYGISDGANRTGSGILRDVETTVLDPNFSETEVLLDQSKGKGACHGDSGGPAYVKVGDTWMLWGVTNRGVNDPKNDCSVSGSYASVVAYQTWITQTEQQLMATPEPQQATQQSPVAKVPQTEAQRQSLAPKSQKAI
jgi:secreted trypsin-like serine protease